jgi:large subunit ribosomal protein L5
MHFFKIFYFKTLKYDLINKFKYKNVIKLPKFKNIILNLNTKMVNIKQLLSKLLAVELVSSQKGCLLFSKNSMFAFKIRKNNPIGCKVTIKNNNLFKIMGRITIKLFSKFNNLNDYNSYFKIQKDKFLCDLKNIFTFFELENYYYYLNNLSKLFIAIILYYTNKKELIFVLKSFKFPFKFNNKIKKN